MTEQENLGEIVEKKQRYDKKVFRLKEYLMKEKGLCKDDALKLARFVTRKTESNRVGSDTRYMEKHFSDITNEDIDPDKEFWEKMGIEDENARIEMELRFEVLNGSKL